MVLLIEDRVIPERGCVRVLTLNRPERRNALTAELCGALVAALAGTAEAIAVVLRGAGAGFCAGADLEERRALAGEALAARRALSDALLAAPGALGKPVVAALHGAVVGAGASLALCCDMAVAAEGTRFLWPEARHGIYPSLVAPMLQRHVGPKAMFELLATGRAVPAAEALALGLVNRVVPEDALLNTACALAAEAAQYEPEVLARVKAMIDAGGLAP